jgi:hypothetical protein
MISARRAWTGPRPLALMLCAFLAVVAGCSTEYKPLVDGPGVPALIPGKFALTSVDGKVIPHTLADSSVTFISGDAVTTEDKFTINLTTATRTGQPTAQVFTGFVAAYNRGSVIFQFSASANQATVLITGNGFVIPFNGASLGFERIG